MEGTVRAKSVVWLATGVVVTLLAALVLTQTWRVDAAPGDADATFVPITPCRLVDTRLPGEDPPLSADETRTFAAYGTNGPIVGSQCTIPSDAVGLSMNVTALDAAAWTYWTIWPDGQPRPEASSLNPVPGQPPTPNAVTTPISTAGRFNVYNFAGTVGMLIDVNGYYTNTSLDEIDARIGELEATQPFAVSVNERDLTAITSDARTIFSLSLADRTTDGTITVNYSITVEQDEPGVVVECGLVLPDEPSLVQQWESPGSPGSIASLSGTGASSYQVGAPDAGYVGLDCWHSGSGSPTIASDAAMTAIFTPAP